MHRINVNTHNHAQKDINLAINPPMFEKRKTVKSESRPTGRTWILKIKQINKTRATVPLTFERRAFGEV